MSETKVLLLRFVRGFVAGFVGAAATIIVPNIASIEELGDWMFALGMAGLVGGITGGLLALDKALRWEDK